jgi:cytoskeleton protein RodZ
MDVGGELRRARTARQLSLVDIAARTKINQTILRAIEENRFDRVPGGLFTRGYLRAYAREVHLDPEETVEQYRSEFEPPIVESPSPEETPHRLDVDALTVDDASRDSPRGVGLAIVLLIGAAYFGLFARSLTSSSTADTSLKPTDAAEAAAPASTPTPTTGTLDASPAGPLKLVIETKADCWVAGSIDGAPAIARLMKSGEREQFDVQDRASLRIGDPSALSFTLDGMPGRVLGTAHTAVNLTFDRKSYKSVLDERPR